MAPVNTRSRVMSTRTSDSVFRMMRINPAVSPLSELRAARRVTVRLSCLDGQLMAKSSGMWSFPLFFPVSVPRTRNAVFCLRLTSPRIWARDISRTISQARHGGMDTVRDIENNRIRASNKDKVKMLFVNSFRQLTGVDDHPSGGYFCTRCVLPCCVGTGRDYTHVLAQMWMRLVVQRNGRVKMLKRDRERYVNASLAPDARVHLSRVSMGHGP